MNTTIREVTAEQALNEMFQRDEFKDAGIPVSRYLREMFDHGFTQERAMRDLEILASQGKVRIESGYRLRDAA